MAKFIKLHRQDGYSFMWVNVRFVDTIHPHKGGATITLASVSADDDCGIHVTETPEQILALIERGEAS